MTKVSVIIPAFNREGTIDRALNSVLDQDFENFEIIVVDDCSDDDTVEVVMEFDDDRIKCIQHHTNKGASEARNTGIKCAKGQYIAFLDSDDEWDSDKLRRQIQKIEQANQTIGVIYTGYQVKYSGEMEVGQVPSKKGDIYQAQLAKDWVSPTSAVMVKAECFDAVGGFDTSLPARQDYEMWLRLSQRYEFEYIKEPLVTLHTESKNRITTDIQSRIQAHKMLLDRLDNDISNLPFHQRRKVIATQYFTIARYSQRHSAGNLAIKFFVRSIMINPLYFKAWLAFLLLLVGLNPDEGRLLSAKNAIKSLK